MLHINNNYAIINECYYKRVLVYTYIHRKNNDNFFEGKNIIKIVGFTHSVGRASVAC